MLKQLGKRGLLAAMLLRRQRFTYWESTNSIEESIKKFAATIYFVLFAASSFAGPSDKLVENYLRATMARESVDAQARGLARQYATTSSPKQMAEINRYLNSVLDWDVVKPQYIKIIKEIYTAEEINASLAFIESKPGKSLIVSAAYGKNEFKSLEEARMAAVANTWHIEVAHVPNRTPGAAEGQTWVGHMPVVEAELVAYKEWRTAFDRGDAGVF